LHDPPDRRRFFLNFSVSPGRLCHARQWNTSRRKHESSSWSCAAIHID
jgi:hypothetical protein